MDSSDLAALATLEALLEESSVSAAARRLGLSAPAVSHALARLRERFDDPLLVRAGRRMVLTPRAQALIPRVREALAASRAVFEDDAPFEPASMSRAFTVSMTDYVLIVLGESLERGLDAAPGLELRVVSNPVDDARRIREGATDLAIGIYGELPPELRMRPIITDRLVCVVRDDHPSVGDALDLDEYVALDHVQVAPRGRPGGYVDELLADHGLTRRVGRAVPYFQVALSMVARSDRVLTVSERVARALAPGLGLRVLEPPLPLEPFALSMIWHPRYGSDPGHRWLRERFFEASELVGALSHEGARRSLSPTDPTTGVGGPSGR